MKNYALFVSCSTTKIQRAYLLPILNTRHTWGGKGLWRFYMESNTSAEAGSPTASCSWLCPIRFCVPLKIGTPQWSKVACSSTQWPLHSEKVLYLNGISWFSVCALYFSCLLSFHCTPPRRKPDTTSLFPDRHLYMLLKSPPDFPSQWQNPQVFQPLQGLEILQSPLIAKYYATQRKIVSDTDSIPKLHSTEIYHSWEAWNQSHSLHMENYY